MKDIYGRKSIHSVLARSYFMFFLLLLVGILVAIVFDSPITDTISPKTGVLLLVLGTVIIMWAQSTSRRTYEQRHTEDEHTRKVFQRGPYRFFRSPTHLGLFVMTFGAAVLANSKTMVVASIVAFLVTRFTFVREEERILLQKHGESYRNYKKRVPL